MPSFVDGIPHFWAELRDLDTETPGDNTARMADLEHVYREILLDKMSPLHEKTIDAYPSDGVLLDLDAYVEEPPYPTGLSVSDFVSGAVGDFQEIKKLVLAKN